ncbi:MAG: M20/M25/M40 family metallo-hydrolase [Bacteroidia bacterium]
MKRFLLSVSILSGISVLLMAFPLLPVQTDRQKDVFTSIRAEELHNQKVAEELKTATSQIGHRLTGSENGKKAELFALNLFKKYGYADTRLEEFEVDAWRRKDVKLNLYYSGSDTLRPRPVSGTGFPNKLDPGNAGCVTIAEVVSLAHTPLQADVFARIIDLDNGLRKDFEQHHDSIKGKIILLNLGIYPKDSTLRNLHRSEKAALAMQFGAKGCIFINQVEGRILLTGTASVDGTLITIPAICICQEDGLSLRQCLKLSPVVYARVVMHNQSGNIKAGNIVATLPGTDMKSEEIILCGHLDSWDLATGAIDNGIGSFTVLEIARIFKKLNIKPRRTIRFVTFMGEEQGLLGSRAMVRERIKKNTLGQIRMVINLDMAGNTQGFNAGGRPEMEAFVKKVISDMQAVEPSFKGSFENSAGLHSDHQPFLEQGIPTLSPEGSLDPYVYKFYHSNKDDFSLVNPEHMSRCATFTAMMLYALADASSLPAKKLSEEETKAFFIKSNLKDELLLEKQWRWEK